MVDPFYAAVRVIARFWIWFFFERVEVRSPWRVPSTGPVLLCINHPGWLARRMSRRETDYATTRLLASVVAFPLFWALETSLVGWAAGLQWLLVFLLSLPLGGLIAYRYLVGTGRLRHQLRFGALLLTRAQEARRLLAERREILDELERTIRDYPGSAKGASA